MKKKIITSIFISVLLAVSFVAGFSASKSQAVVPLAFGGHLVSWTACTCSASLWLFYAPMPDSSFLGGPLNYTPYGTITYPYYNMVTPGVWHLGTYLPGIQSCWVYTGHICVPLPELGQEVMVGTSAVPTPFN